MSRLLRCTCAAMQDNHSNKHNHSHAQGQHVEREQHQWKHVHRIHMMNLRAGDECSNNFWQDCRIAMTAHPSRLGMLYKVGGKITLPAGLSIGQTGWLALVRYCRFSTNSNNPLPNAASTNAFGSGTSLMMLYTAGTGGRPYKTKPGSFAVGA